MRSAWAEINLDAIRKNIKYLKSRTDPATKLMGVIKANAYGHGVIPVAQILREEGVSHFGVAIVEEGIELRQAGFHEPILILGKAFEEDYSLILQYNLMPTIFSMKQAVILNEVAGKANRKATIHIKIDTGMGRLGFMLKDDTIYQIAKIAALPNLRIEGIFSHFATSPQISDITYCMGQFLKFIKLLEELERLGLRFPLRHLSNSGATILFPEMQLDMVRPGTSIFGLYPGPELEKMSEVTLYPAMEIKARLAYVKPCPAGTRVSYTGSFVTTHSSVLGIVPLGYVDGIFRNLANRGEVLLHGKRCSMVGNICMDQFVIDITHITNPIEGDEIVIVGRQGNEFISAEEIGEKAGTISIEVLCGLGKRMPLVYRNTLIV